MEQGVAGAPRCGTTRGYADHRARGERPCEACTKAKAEYDLGRRNTGDTRVKDRLRSKAQSQALKVLAHRYPVEYRIAYETAVEELFAEAGLPR